MAHSPRRGEVRIRRELADLPGLTYFFLSLSVPCRRISACVRSNSSGCPRR
jgi:hypothetical protein